MAGYKIKSYEHIYSQSKTFQFKFWVRGIAIGFIIFLFLPWTQNIQTNGQITTRYQENRPQDIQSQIAGRIIEWKVKDGDIVKKGDTLLILREVKDNYLDPKLIDRTREQANAKRSSVSFYLDKANALSQQMKALNQGRSLEIVQLENYLAILKSKLEGEQAELLAANNEYQFALNQRDRQQKMFEEGLVSQTQLQQREVSYQNTLAKKIVSENKIRQLKQEIENNQVLRNSAIQLYNEKIQKADADRFSSLSDANTSKADAAKLENQTSNYEIRSQMYCLTALQDGQIVQVRKSGIGEIVKDGEIVCTIVPKLTGNYAVEVFVRPVDLPLLENGQRVRLIFDGFPTIVFTGWPKGSYGTFGGEIVVNENTISPNGMFRVLITEDPNDSQWPQQIKVGSGAKGIILLKNVPIWYEFWRNINGFPPDYYKSYTKAKTKKLEKLD